MKQKSKAKMKVVNVLNGRFPLIGPLLWIFSVQYFVTQIVAAAKWPGFSLQQNTISDLGNTACGMYGERYVCSAWHAWMNASFIILGLTMMFGSALIYQKFKETQYSMLGFSLMAIGGFGTMLVGLFPENSVSGLHVVGAALPFFIGNISLIVLGLALQMPKSLRAYTLLSGVFALIALAFFLSGNYLGLGVGGLERVIAYPQTFWLIIFGAYLWTRQNSTAKNA